MSTQWNESLWGDEGFSALAVKNNFFETMGIMMRDTSPPGFYVLGWLWGRMFGYSEMALRSMSLLLMAGAAVFAGLLVYQIGKNKVNSVPTGLLAFGAPFLVPYAFEFRMYALLTFAVMGSIYFFVAKKWWWYVVLTLLMIYTHHFGLFTLAAEGVVFLVDWWFHPGGVQGHPQGETLLKKFLKDFWPFLVILGLYLPWMYPFYLQLKRVQGSGFWLQVPKTEEVKDLLWKFVTGGVKEQWRGGVKILVGIVLLTKDWKKVWKVWWKLALVFVAPVGLSWGVSYVVTPIFYDRYLLSVVMGMMVLVGLGTRKKITLLLVVMVVIFWWQSGEGFLNPSKRPFREMAGVVKQELKTGDVLVNYNGAAHHIWESKYYGLLAPIYSPGGPLPLYVGTAQMKEGDVIYKLPVVKDGRLGVVTSEPVDKLVLPGYKRVENQQFGSLSFSWWKKI